MKDKKKNKLYILALQTDSGKIKSLLFHENYDVLLQEALERTNSKLYWTIFNEFGRLIDSNFHK